MVLARAPFQQANSSVDIESGGSRSDDLLVINGTIAPKQSVQPRRYTFTFINGSDSRFYHLTLKPAGRTTGAAPRMTVVGSDSGYVLKPAKVNDLLIAPGERYTVVVDFTGHSGQWVLSNDAATPYPGGDPDVASIPQLMRFDVGAEVTGKDRSSVPPTIRETNNMVPTSISLLTARLRTVQAGEIVSGMPLLGNATGLLNFPAPRLKRQNLVRPRPGRCATIVRIRIPSTNTSSSCAWSDAGPLPSGGHRIQSLAMQSH